MYPITCVAGFNMPAKAGKFEVWGFHVAVSDATLSSDFAIVDDPNIKSSDSVGKLLTTLTEQKGVLAYVKRYAASDGYMECTFAEPVKTRYGISIYGTNMVQGSVNVFVR